jgi:hypothetical protein
MKSSAMALTKIRKLIVSLWLAFLEIEKNIFNLWPQDKGGNACEI